MMYVMPILTKEHRETGVVEFVKPCANIQNAKMRAENDADAQLRWNAPRGDDAEHVATTDVAMYRISSEIIGRVGSLTFTSSQRGFDP